MLMRLTGIPADVLIPAPASTTTLLADLSFLAIASISAFDSGLIVIMVVCPGVMTARSVDLELKDGETMRQ